MTATRRATPAAIAREWTRIGVIGFGGPPAHIALLRDLVVARRRWFQPQAFEDAIAACNLLPGPASTQLAIFAAYRVGGPWGAVIGGLGFVVPAVVLVLLLSTLFLGHAPPLWVRGAGGGAGAAVAAVAVRAGLDLLRSSRAAALWSPGRRLRRTVYVLAGGAGAALAGPYLVLVLLGCGLAELMLRRSRRRRRPASARLALLPLATAKGSLAALSWTAFKVGALAFGGGFVIIPLMQGDAVHTYHWMTNTQFLNAVALGQVTPGPVVATVAAVGYAAHGVAGGIVAALVAFAPSFSFVLIGGGRFERLRSNESARAFLEGAGPAAVGAILGAAIPLAGALQETWQALVLAAAAVALLALRRGIVETLVVAGVAGAVIVLARGAAP
ncbi:MAG TPA: chromate efflux transporter [Solirubrobacteraceae bacterium]|nr:chromate efflux transporter [Solirubrobacteraceae bacterium]